MLVAKQRSMRYCGSFDKPPTVRVPPLRKDAMQSSSGNEEVWGRGSPATHTRFFRLRGPVQQGPVHRQETQIVQPRMTLDDFLP